MKLRYKGGNIVQRQVPSDPKDPASKPVTKQFDELTQLLEEMEYHFPSPGSVLSVPANVGAWLLGKCKPYLEDVGRDEDDAPKARRLVGVTPADATAPAASPDKGAPQKPK